MNILLLNNFTEHSEHYSAIDSPAALYRYIYISIPGRYQQPKHAGSQSECTIFSVNHLALHVHFDIGALQAINFGHYHFILISASILFINLFVQRRSPYSPLASFSSSFSSRFTLFMFSSHLCSSVIRIVNATFCIVSRSLVEIGSVRDDGD